MEDFSTADINSQSLGDIKSDSLDMKVSGVCTNAEGEKYAFISFEDGSRMAEGKIPDCKIIRSKGFSDTQLEALETYMRDNLKSLKIMASNVNVMSAFMKK